VFSDFDGKRSNLVGVSADKSLQGTRQVVVFSLANQLQQIYNASQPLN